MLRHYSMSGHEKVSIWKTIRYGDVKNRCHRIHHADSLTLFYPDDIPDGFFRQLTTCQTAANEFLRQFWSATYPLPVDSQSILSIATPAQRAAKAAKMIGYLAKTSEKVDSLVRLAQQHGVDGSRVETVRPFIRIPSACLRLLMMSTKAMRPLLNAVNHALKFHQNKKLQPPPARR